MVGLRKRGLTAEERARHVHGNAEPLLQRCVLLVVLELDPRRSRIQDLTRPRAVVLADPELHGRALLRRAKDRPVDGIAVSGGRGGARRPPRAPGRRGSTLSCSPYSVASAATARMPRRVSATRTPCSTSAGIAPSSERRSFSGTAPCSVARISAALNLTSGSIELRFSRMRRPKSRIMCAALYRYTPDRPVATASRSWLS